MTTPRPHDFNPYQSPVPVEVVGEALAPPPELKILKRFRREMQGLGGVSIIIGALGVFSLLVMLNAPAHLAQGIDRILVAVSLVVCGTWIVLGIFTCLKQMWAVWVGLILSYVALLGDSITFIRLISIGGGEAICTSVIVGFVVLIIIAIIVQAHRCIRWAGQLAAAGIPLTARPSDFLFVPPPGTF